MKIFLAEGECRPGVYSSGRFAKIAAADRVGRHCLVDSAEAADAVLFTDCHLMHPNLRELFRSPAFTKFRDKIYVYNERDDPWCAAPGAYVAMPATGFVPRFQRAVPYWDTRDPRDRVDVRLGITEPDLLFSFIGSSTHPVREAIFALRHERAAIQRVENFIFWDRRDESHELLEEQFDGVIMRSKFVLCPRGFGTSSFRLYEALAAGRVPVIISDEWVPPEGPKWSDISLRIRECEIPDIVSLVERAEVRYPQMAADAASAYGLFFSREVAFDTIAEKLQELVAVEAAAEFHWWRRRTSDTAGRLQRRAAGRIRPAIELAKRV